MKMQKVSFLLAAMMLAATPAFAQESETQAAVQETQAAVPETDAAAQSETNAAAQSETDAADAQTETGAAAQPAVLSDKWSDFQIQIDDQIYQFPMMYSDFVAYGWTNEDSELPTLEPEQYDMSLSSMICCILQKTEQNVWHM